VFSHASGIHLTGLNRDAAAYEAFSPDLVGHAPSRHYFGIQSGPAALQEFASKSGHSIPAAELPEITRRLQNFCRDQRVALSPAEAIHLATHP
jgi:isopropylmalate/homocitrate/citramalate synthase